MKTLFHELRLAVRSLSKSPTLSLVAVLTLAVGIGASTAIFTLAHAVLLSPLPYPEPDRLVRVLPEAPVSPELFDHFAASADGFDEVAIAVPTGVSLLDDGRPQEVPGLRVSPEYFKVLGVEPALGSGFDPTARRPGSPPVAMLSHHLWQSRFGGDPGVVGRTVRLGQGSATVVGVLPASFEPLYEDTEIWVPIVVDPGREEYWDWIGYALYGRLASGVTTERATGELRAVLAHYEELRPGFLGSFAATATVEPLREALTGGFETTFALLFVGVGVVLLIACANLANLMLARLTARRHELALRSALGAGALQLTGQVLAESLVLSVVGGLLGVEGAWWAVREVASGMLPDAMPRTAGATVDGPVLVFALGLALLTTLLVGVLPVLRAVRVDPQTQLAASPRSSSPRRHRLNHLLVAVEVALAVVLVVAAGLLVRSFAAVHQEELGFDPSRVLTVQLQAPDDIPEGPQRGRFFEQVLESVRTVPGVSAAAAMSRSPMTPGDVGLGFGLEGREMPPGMRSVSVRLVSPGFAEALQVPLVAGRALSPRDRADTPQVGLINRSLATRLFGTEDPVGQRLVFKETGGLWFTVVGVVGDIKQHRLDRATEPQVYRPIAQASWEPRMSLLVRTDTLPESVVTGVEEAIWSVAPEVPVSRVATMDELIDRSLEDRRLLVTLFSGFGAVGLLLGIVGVFGVTTYVAGQQRIENGIRLALGATSFQVVGLTLRRTLGAVGLGLAAGYLASLLLGRLIEGFLFAVGPRDPMVYVTVFVALVAAATVAAWLPARRAGQVEPTEVLKAE